MSKVYDQLKEGEPFFHEDGQTLHLACCDCALTHEMQFKKVRGGLSITCKPQARITASIRSHHNIKVRKAKSWSPPEKGL